MYCAKDGICRFVIGKLAQQRKQRSAAVKSLGRQEIEKRKKKIAEEKVEDQRRKNLSQKKNESSAKKKSRHGACQRNYDLFPIRKIGVSRYDLRTQRSQRKAFYGYAERNDGNEMSSLMDQNRQGEKKCFLGTACEEKKKPRKKKKTAFHRNTSFS